MADNASVSISPIELLALKKLVLVNDMLARSLQDDGARREQRALTNVLNDVVLRADIQIRKDP